MTNVTIIIHEGRGGRGPAGRMGRHHGRPEEQTEARGEHHGRHHHGAGCGHRHEHGERQGGFGHPGRSQEQTEGRGEHRHGMGHGRHHDAGHAPGSPTDEQRQLARRLRHQLRHIMQEAEAAGLSPERIERVVRRETRRSYL